MTGIPNIVWQHAGKKPKHANDDTANANATEQWKSQWLEGEWTADEQSIIAATEHGGLVMLAIHVVRQWIKDGKPKTSYEGIKPWLSIIKDSLHDKDAKLELATVAYGANSEANSKEQ